MFYELRRYDVAAGKLPALVDRFGSFTVHKWKEYGFRLIGFWTPVVAEKSNQLVYIWGWESFEERAKKNAAWRADPERAKKWAETEKDGPLVNAVYNQLMEPTSYSQIDRGEPYGPDASSRSPYFFELREYQAMPGKIQNITDRFGNFTCGAFKKHGFRQVGYWQTCSAATATSSSIFWRGRAWRARVQVRHVRQGPRARPRVRGEREERSDRSASAQHDPASHGFLTDEVSL